MDFFITIYNLFLFQPIFNALVFLAETIPGKDFGVAVIILTVGVRFASYPLGAQGVTMQKKMAELQPKVQEIKEKFKDKREEQTKAIMRLYKDAKLNPFASFLPILVQIPIFFVFYQIFSGGLTKERFSALYSFVQAPETTDAFLLGLVNLNEQSFTIAVLAGALLFVQLKQASPKKKKKKKSDKPDIASIMQTQMPYIFPIIIVWVASNLPAAFGLYLVTTTVFSIWQYWFMARKDKGGKADAVSVQDPTPGKAGL